MKEPKQLTLGSLLIALGIIFGDIGTSPLYVVKAFIGKASPSEALVLGGLSCIFWTLSLQTTVKYVLVTLQADNHGEGGIFALYALIRRRKKWLFVPAVIGGSTLLADSIITPSISVTSAVEGLEVIIPHFPVIPACLIILSLLFFFQRAGTAMVGRSFGPVMLLWFTMLATLGLGSLWQNPGILRAINPYYAYQLLVNYPGGFWLLGAIFLCTTGAEALYSDLGHCGRQNIQVSWIFVKTALLLNYFGQGAWALRQGQAPLTENPFYALMPDWFLWVGVTISTLAVVVASQALISGAYTLINEAVQLNFWPKVGVRYPTNFRGQVYLPSINRFLWMGCIGVVLYFRESSNMEAAYGLSIIITMLMTSLLLCFYLYYKQYSRWIIVGFILIYGLIEGAFLWANLSKFVHGGWITAVIALLLITVMCGWYLARKIRRKYLEFTKIEPYIPLLLQLSEDHDIPKYATHLVYLTRADRKTDVESRVMYSILERQPKRADVYWFIHVDFQDRPYAAEYELYQLVEKKIIRIDFKLGFRETPHIDLMFRKVLEQLRASKEIDITTPYTSLSQNRIVGDFQFVVLESVINYDDQFSFIERQLLQFYYLLKYLGITEEQAYGLDGNLVTKEKVPLRLQTNLQVQLSRST